MNPATFPSGPGEPSQASGGNFPEGSFPLLAIGLSHESEAFLRRVLTLERGAPPLILVNEPSEAAPILNPIAGGIVEADSTGGFPISYVQYINQRDPDAPVIALVREAVPPNLEQTDPLIPIVPVPISESGADLLRRAVVLAKGRAGLLARLTAVEIAMERRSERFHALTLTTGIAVWDWDLAEGRIWRSEGFESLFGYVPSEIEETLRWWSERVHPEDHERVVPRMDTALSGDEDQLHLSYRFRAKDGSYIRVLDSAVVLKGNDERPVRLIGTVREDGNGNAGERISKGSRLPVTAREAMKRLSLIEQVTDVTLAKLNLEDMLTELLGRLRAVLDADAALAHLLTEDGTTLMRRAWIGVGGDPPKPVIPIPVGAGISGRIAASGKPMVVLDIHSGPIRPVGPIAEFTSLLGVPLTVEGKTIGVLSVLTRKSRDFSQSDQSLIQIVADRVAFVVDRANLHHRLRSEHRHLEALSRRLVKLQEEERRGIARELHDGAGQILMSLKLALETEPLDRGRCESLLQELYDQLGEISMNLRPPMLDDLGLLPALRWHIRRFSSLSGVEAHLHSEGVNDRLRAELELAAFRIVQEALTNVARHAHTDTAAVALIQESGVLRIRVSDSGSGFDHDAVSPSVGSGLIGMRERATLLGGSLSIQSSPGSGTEVIAELPLT